MIDGAASKMAAINALGFFLIPAINSRVKKFSEHRQRQGNEDVNLKSWGVYGHHLRSALRGLSNFFRVRPERRISSLEV